MNALPFYDEARIAALLKPAEAIAAAREAMATLSQGGVDVAPRTRWMQQDPRSAILAMFASSRTIDRYIIKTLGVYPDNHLQGLPSIQGQATLFDRRSGTPIAAFDAEALTAARTAAVAAVAVDSLMPHEPVRMALFGTGALCQPIIETIVAARPIAEVILVGRNFAKAQHLAQKLSDALGLACRAAPDAGAVADCNLVVTATTASTPLFEAQAISPSALIVGIGTFEPDKAEIPAAIVQSAQLYVDSRPACAAEAGDLLLALGDAARVAASVRELGEQLLDPAPVDFAARRFFKSVGNAGQDLFAAVAIARAAGA